MAKKKKKAAGRMGRLVRGTAKTLIDFPSWIGVNSLKDGTQGIIQTAKPLFQKEKSNREETFEAAMWRFKLSEEDLQAKSLGLFRQVWIYCVVAALLLLYAIFLLCLGKFGLSMIALLVMGLPLCKAQRAHFLRYQIQKRKLGCSFQEWFDDTVRRKK